MNKQQFIEYINNLKKLANFSPNAENEIERAEQKIDVQVANSKLKALYDKSLRNMSKEQIAQMADLFPKENQRDFR